MKPLLNKFESIGRYKIIRELGRGGMSVVYLAQDTKLGRDVAIKCVEANSDVSASLVDRLRAEAKLLAQLNNPNIVQLYDVVEQNNVLGLVIEYVGGETLTHRLQQAPSRELKLKWLAEIAHGISCAHKQGIAHCDLKSENILITTDNIAKVADFGIAKLKLDDYLEDDGLTRMDSVSGSYFSLSPEQATGQTVDTRTDLFSLAVLIHQALLTEHPFGETNNKIALIQRVINDPFKLSDSSLDGLGVRLAELVKNCLSKSPEDRLYNATEVADLLRNEISKSSKTDNHQHDYTVAIETQQPKLKKLTLFSKITRNIAPKLAFVIGGAALGFGLLKWLSPTEVIEDSVNYIALDTIEVTATEDFNKDLLVLIKSTLQQSTESTVLSFKQTGLVDAKELNAFEGSYSDKAKAAGVENVLVVSADCMQQKCDIRMQHRSGERMAVSEQTNFPVASDSLIDLKNAISAQLPNLFNHLDSEYIKNEITLSEENYRKYLEIYIDSKSGISTDPEYFDRIQNLIEESPYFLPSYYLLYSLGNYLHRNTGDKKHLDAVSSLLDSAPISVINDPIIKRTKISLLLSYNKLDESKLIYSELQSQNIDKLILSEIESSIAYAEKDYQRLLSLDRQNAIWRPSINNLYNLATSEYFSGNYEEAKEITARALELSPKDSDILTLRASIEMSLGELNKAIEIYEALLLDSQNSEIYSNYGLVLTLNKEYNKAIDANRKAIKINPSASLYHLNLADSLTLSGNFELAKQSYNKVVNLLVKPQTAQENSSLAQAYAHLGQFEKSIKTLKEANKMFSHIAELDYAASIVNTLSSNHMAAVVDVNDAIERGISPIWFSLEWFKPLCNYEGFKTHTGDTIKDFCSQ